MRDRFKPYLFWILAVFLLIGMFYPAVGVVAIICMLAPVIMAPFKGRYWCGNYCPRGNFYDNIIARISPKKPIPAFFRSKIFKIVMLVLIMTVFAVQMYYAWGNLAEMGAVFVRIIFVTTAVGVILGAAYHQRAWCSFCPMGTMATWCSKRPAA